jgi:hypothetical protein
VSVAAALAEWSVEKPLRRVGLIPPEGFERLFQTEDPLPASPVVVNCGQDGCSVRTSTWNRQFRDSTIRRWLKSRRVEAIAVTGHSAEDCIRFGEKYWLCSPPLFEGSADCIRPSDLSAKWWFLNGCATVRTGDSLIPSTRSLAVQLFQRGSTIVGAFRNHAPAAELHDEFTRGVLEGLDVGTIVAGLNRFQRSHSDEPVSLITLGDPTVRLSALDCSTTLREIEHASSASSIDAYERRAMALLDVVRSLLFWGVSLPHSNSPHHGLAETMKLLGALTRESVQRSLGACGVENILRSVERTRSGLATALLKDLALRVRTGSWLYRAVAPVMRSERLTDRDCHTCGHRVVRTRFHAPHRQAVAFYDEQCDRCGTVSNHIGQGLSIDLRVRAVLSCDGIDISVPALPTHGNGCVTMHNAPNLRPRAWPLRGGRVHYSLAEIPRRGKLSLCCIAVGPTGVSLFYSHLYCPPDGLEGSAGEHSPKSCG